MAKARVLISSSHDPWFNLAVEDTIFQAMPSDQRILFLWRNSDTVVIGRGQNPWKECNTRKMEEDQVKLARRQTGGGAVFHDLGNTNFTFMGGKPEFDKSISTAIVLTALQSLGIDGRASGRNDLVVNTSEGDKKFSGSAYRDAADRGFHHGTLLLNANLSRLANYLNPDPKKLQAKGIQSVRSRVVNLCELVPGLNHESICDAIELAFLSYFESTVTREMISSESFQNEPGFAQRHQKQSDWNWNFGKSLEFNHTLEERFEWGSIDLHLNIERGHIQETKIFTDSLDLAPLEELAELLVGRAYTPSTIVECISETRQRYPDSTSRLVELQSWLQHQVS